MIQPQLWSQQTYAPDLQWIPNPPSDLPMPGPFPPSRVHTQESESPNDDPSLPKHNPLYHTSAESLDADDSATAVAFRHSGWRSTRERVQQAFHDSDAPPSRIIAFNQCGRRAYVLESIDEPGHYRITSSKCKDRFCKPCARERAGRVARNLLDAVDAKELRFITLTLKTQIPDLRHELNRLYKAFQALRKRAFWKGHVTGGAALLEVKHNEKADRWHPHLHVLVTGRYIPKTGLASEWRHVTGDSFIVDVRAIRDNKRVTQYICKYATDPIDRSIGKSTTLLTEAINAFIGRKSCLTFGTFRRVVLTAPTDTSAWRHLATLNRIIWQAEMGFEHAKAIINSLWIYTEDQQKGTTNPNGRSRPPPSDDLLFP